MKVPLTVFDIHGFLAQFRKHHTTTSSLSYAFPPRTTIIGIIAAVLGYEKNDYYQLFNSEKCRIALQIKSKIKHITQTLNYLMTKQININTLRGKGRRTQIHTDFILADSSNLSDLSYRIFFSHEDIAIQKKLTEHIMNQRFNYPPSLGPANALAELEYNNFTEAEIFKPEGKLEVHTIIPVSIIKTIQPQSDTRVYIEELVPADFNPDRTLRRTETYIYEGTGKKINVILTSEAFRCKISEGEVVGVFM
ncbi:MAG: type I-B CRISPR-associated protein Cas5b [Candidatus Odinarchaeota archaeon]